MHPMPGPDVHYRSTPHVPVPLAVSRLVALATEDAAWVLAAFAPGGAGAVRLDEPFRPSAWVVHGWRARGRLAGGRRRGGTRIEVAVDGGPGRPVELSIRPAGRGAQLWGRRRLDRYFDASRRAADELSRQLAELANPATLCADDQVILAA